MMMIFPKTFVLAILSGAALCCATSALAQETKTFKYDALGRLVEVTTDGGVITKTVFDKAGNRTNYEVVGSANQSPPPAGFVVVPISGFVVIPISG